MKLKNAVAVGAAVVVVAVGGGIAVAQVHHRAAPDLTSPSPGASRTSGPPPVTPGADPTALPSSGSAVPAAPTSTPSPVATPKPLSADNLLTPQAYQKVTGRARPQAKRADEELNGVCDRTTFTQALPDRSAPTASVQLGDRRDRFVLEHVAEASSPEEARSAAKEIIALTRACSDDIQGGDFGYSQPITLRSSATQLIVYFITFDSDQPDQGGYLVFQTGARVGVINVNDQVSVATLKQLGTVAVDLAEK